MNVVLVALVALFSNIILGVFRCRYPRYSIKWFVLVHLSILWIWPLRNLLDIPGLFVPIFIVVALLGQFLGVRLARYLNTH